MRNTDLTPRARLVTPWAVRMIIYILVAVAGLVATVTGYVEPATVDGWLGHVPGWAALIGGVLASWHIGPRVQETPAAGTPSIDGR